MKQLKLEKFENILEVKFKDKTYRKKLDYAKVIIPKVIMKN